MIPFSKTGTKEGLLKDIKPIMVLRHISKIIEKTLMNKLDK